MAHEPDSQRYERAGFYRPCGRSGIKLPLLSLGFWHNFGAVNDFANCRSMVLKAFDLGITHFDLADNYGPPAGTAEVTFGRILAAELPACRDEMVISTKAGYPMWPGPYGDWGSRKHLLAGLDQSLRRMGLEYVDIFYHHRLDPSTPMEETMGALTHAVRAGKALYVGLSNYGPEETARAAQMLRASGTPCLIHQMRYHMFSRQPEDGLFDLLVKEGIGGIAFCPLAQGQLTDRYLTGIAPDSRVARDPRFLKPEHITEAKRVILRALDRLARERGQSLAQMALVWVLRQAGVTSALVGASKPSQIVENVKALEKATFSADELAAIDRILGSNGVA